ncbi:MAG: serine acetyltransferase [Methylobacteriaceae bacterium]|jgi:serine O-acetyltransferase|nr:serine acetyltransferase [Methylobacteriaceae bacterium]
MSHSYYERTTDLVSAVLENYEENAPFIPLGLDLLPDRDEVVEILHLLRELLFPGFIDHRALEARLTHYQIAHRIETIHMRLTVQVLKAFRNRKQKEAVAAGAIPMIDDAALEAEAKRKAMEFLELIPCIRTMLAMDVQAAYDGDPSARGTDEIVFSFPCIQAISIYRLAHELHTMDIPLIPRIMTEYAHSITGIDIHPGAQIGQHFFIDHGTGVVIGETTEIGNNVKLYQGVTLGALSLKAGQGLRGKKRHPTLKDNVVIYSGASILGGETVIGEGVTIGSNVFITKSVPDHTTVSLRVPDLLYKDAGTENFGQFAALNWEI